MYYYRSDGRSRIVDGDGGGTETRSTYQWDNGSDGETDVNYGRNDDRNSDSFGGGVSNEEQDKQW